MKNIYKYQLFILVLALGIMGVSHASATNMSKYIWGPPHSDFVKPHLNAAKTPHNHKSGEDNWLPEDWALARGGNPMAVVNGFYEADIVTDQYFDDEIPVLEVGQGFINLSDTDKKRVIMYMDDVFGVTEFSPSKTLLVYFYRGNKSLGIATPQGVQLQ